MTTLRNNLGHQVRPGLPDHQDQPDLRGRSGFPGTPGLRGHEDRLDLPETPGLPERPGLPGTLPVGALDYDPPAPVADCH